MLWTFSTFSWYIFIPKEQKGDEIREEKGRDPTATELKNIEKTKINVTDPDAKFMKERCGVIKSFTSHTSKY